MKPRATANGLVNANGRPPGSPRRSSLGEARERVRQVLGLVHRRNHDTHSRPHRRQDFHWLTRAGSTRRPVKWTLNVRVAEHLKPRRRRPFLRATATWSSPPNMNCDHRVIASSIMHSNQPAASVLADDVTHRLRQRRGVRQSAVTVRSPIAAGAKPRGADSYGRGAIGVVARAAASDVTERISAVRGCQVMSGSCCSVCSSISTARRRLGAPSLCMAEATWRRTVTSEIPSRDAI